VTQNASIVISDSMEIGQFSYWSNISYSSN